MKHVMPMVTLAALAASPLAAQHAHPTPPPPSPAPRAAAPAPRPMMTGGMGGMMMMPGMDSTMGSHRMPMTMEMAGMDSTMRLMAGMDSVMGPLHALMAYAPRALLDRRAELRLDDDQSSRLAGIAALGRPVHDSAMTAAQQHRRALQEALAAGGDPAAAATHFDAMHAALGAAHATELRAALEARALLTAGQRSLVEAPAHRHGGGS